jgi:tRNA threonylcarbamoyladenosine biosynthesis protein TsaB
MKILALDTSTLTAQVAVWDERVLAERARPVSTHSETLLSLVDECLREAGLRASDLDAIACGAGPGSFTGLRIGLASAKGLCFALSRPLLLVSSLEALAARAPDGLVCATLDAYKQEVYAALFRVAGGCAAVDEKGERVLPPATLAAELSERAAGEPIAIVGSGVRRYRELLVPGVRLLDDEEGPRASDVARLAAQKIYRGETDDLARSAPRYIRPSEAELAKLKSSS